MIQGIVPLISLPSESNEKSSLDFLYWIGDVQSKTIADPKYLYVGTMEEVGQLMGGN